MVSETTLSRGDYAVLVRVPPDWWERDQVVREISQTITEPRTIVARRLARLKWNGLIEERKRQTLPPTVEIRRIAKE